MYTHTTILSVHLFTSFCMYTHTTILCVHLFTSFCMYTHTTILYVHLFTSFCMYTHTTILYVHTYLINIVRSHELPTSDLCEHTLTTAFLLKFVIHVQFPCITMHTHLSTMCILLHSPYLLNDEAALFISF